MLFPKKLQYEKIRKGNLKKYNYRCSFLRFGTVGLKSVNSGLITSKQIEAARQAIARKLRRKGKLWICVFPNLPVTKKPIEVRMGKGKGVLSHWGSKISGGSIIFEICGVPRKVAIGAFRTGGAKLPVKTVIFL